MRKYFLFVLLMVILYCSSSGLARSNNYIINQQVQYFPPPDWAEFCPPQYIKSNLDNNSYFVYYKRVRRDEGNYWVKRRQKFQSNINSCQYYYTGDDLLKCYDYVRLSEYNKNITFNNEQEKKALKAQQWDKFINDLNSQIQLEEQRQHELQLKNTPQYHHHNVFIY